MRARGVGRPADGPRTKGKSPPTAAAAAAVRPRKAEPAVEDEDMDDIEAILRKHGIQ